MNLFVLYTIQALNKDENLEGTDEGIITRKKDWEATVKLSWTSSLDNVAKAWKKSPQEKDTSLTIISIENRETKLNVHERYTKSNRGEGEDQQAHLDIWTKLTPP